jgi:hypothetical protein
MPRKPALTLNETLIPLDCTCGTCGGPARIYPRRDGQGSCVCRKCSPFWVARFCLDTLNDWRREKGLGEVT